jgi:shikimate dehydrogenase
VKGWRAVATLIDLLSGLGRGRVSAGPADPTGCDLVCNATPMGMEENDPLPVDAALLTSSMFVGDVIAGHGVTPFLEAAQAAGCKTAYGGHMVEAAQDVRADFMLQTSDASNGWAVWPVQCLVALNTYRFRLKK